MDLPFEKYVEQMLHPQDPISMGNGERDRWPWVCVGGSDLEIPVSCFLLADTLYFFGDNNFTEWASLFRHYSPPPFSLLGTTPAYSFGIAGGCPARRRDLGAGWGRIKLGNQVLLTCLTGAGSGVPFHWHGPGFSEVIYGRKVSTGCRLRLWVH